jgi:hypothetical protein
MIGVLSKNHQAEVVREFFQLFKTPWEFYDNNRSYDVVIATEANDFSAINARLIILYGAEQKSFDSNEAIEIQPKDGSTFLQTDNIEFPIYKNLSAINGHGKPLIRIKNSSDIAGLEIEKSGSKIIRVGYDLLEEVAFLLSVGQPPENALIPTLELHISMLRSWILNSGIPLVEIPPVPAGYNFITCLTHDVDFIRIRDHKFDHTMWGFLYRATIGTLIDVLGGKRQWKKLLQNWKAALTLPFVYLGICRDFWFQFDRYLEIEKNVRSTFFLIPFKNRPGKKVSGRFAERRATKYDIGDILDVAKKLTNQGVEVGVHGIDAWHDAESARQELVRISEVTGRSDIGIRMHWLCFDMNSPRILEEAGFSYDSSFGYNDAVGYRAGCSQAFKPIGVKKIIELPLHIQDTALFNPQRMDLSELQAWQLCKVLIEKALTYSGVLTILWHDRSLAPERLYEDFYIKLLAELKAHNAWFATAGQVTEWFRRRREIIFKEVKLAGDTIQLKLKDDYEGNNHPQMTLRIFNSNSKHSKDEFSYGPAKNYKDIPWDGASELEITLNGAKRN